jgi:hypothetical protein
VESLFKKAVPKEAIVLMIRLPRQETLVPPPHNSRKIERV